MTTVPPLVDVVFTIQSPTVVADVGEDLLVEVDSKVVVVTPGIVVLVDEVVVVEVVGVVTTSGVVRVGAPLGPS